MHIGFKTKYFVNRLSVTNSASLSLYPLLLFLIILIPILVVNFRIQPPRNSEPSKVPLPRPQKVKIQDSPKGRLLQLATKIISPMVSAN